jgi:hypothetical protein
VSYKRVSIYLKDDWFSKLLTIRLEAAKMTGRQTSLGKEILDAAKQQLLREMYDQQEKDK